MSPWALNRFSNAVLQGAVFGYPTDTIWGFGCHPLIAESVSRILKIKNRSSHKGLILLSSRLEFCEPYVDADSDRLNPIRFPAEQPTTWLVDASENCPPWLRGRNPTIAIRITDHPFVESICEKLKSPIVSTSANRAGKSTVRNLIQLRNQFGNELDFMIGGYETGSGQQSEIVFLSDGNILRTPETPPK
jgi:L-threonylcarbamoyladenylate synthase